MWIGYFLFDLIERIDRGPKERFFVTLGSVSLENCFVLAPPKLISKGRPCQMTVEHQEVRGMYASFVMDGV